MTLYVLISLHLSLSRLTFGCWNGVLDSAGAFTLARRCRCFSVRYRGEFIGLVTRRKRSALNAARFRSGLFLMGIIKQRDFPARVSRKRKSQRPQEAKGPSSVYYERWQLRGDSVEKVERFRNCISALAISRCYLYLPFRLSIIPTGEDSILKRDFAIYSLLWALESESNRSSSFRCERSDFIK